MYLFAGFAKKGGFSMRKLKTNSQESEVKDFIKYLNDLLEISNFNLDQFIIDGELSIEDTILENRVNIIQDLCLILPKVIEATNKNYIDELYNEMDDLKENNSLFFTWLSELAKEQYKTYELGKNIREMSVLELEKLVSFCLETSILKKSEDIDEVNKENYKLVKSILEDYFDMIVVKNNSNEFIKKRYYYLLGLEEDYFNVFRKSYLANEDAIWRRVMIKKISGVEHLLYSLIEKNNLPQN